MREFVRKHRYGLSVAAAVASPALMIGSVIDYSVHPGHHSEIIATTDSHNHTYISEVTKDDLTRGQSMMLFLGLVSCIPSITIFRNEQKIMIARQQKLREQHQFADIMVGYLESILPENHADN